MLFSISDLIIFRHTGVGDVVVVGAAVNDVVVVDVYDYNDDDDDDADDADENDNEDDGCLLSNNYCFKTH